MHMLPPSLQTWPRSVPAPRRLWLRGRHSCKQLLNDLGPRLLADAVDLLHLLVGVLLRIVLGLLVARAVLHSCQSRLRVIVSAPRPGFDNGPLSQTS